MPSFATLRVRGAATLVGLAALAGILGAPAVAGAEVAPTRQPLLFGAYAMPRNGQSSASAVTALESSLGRQLGAVRVYDLWNTAFPDSTTRAWRDAGRTLVLSVKAKRTNGTTVTWRSVADAAPGSTVYGEITRWAADRRARRVPNFVIEATGLKTKKQIVAKFGDGVVFEKGKPLPKTK